MSRTAVSAAEPATRSTPRRPQHAQGPEHAGHAGLAWSVARRCAHQAGPPLPTVELTLVAALGATLAAPLRARGAVPAFDTAAMDGYAVAGAGPWRVVGTVLAGSQAHEPLAPGTAVEVGTGAAVPAGTQAVLRYEDANRVDSCLRGSVAAGRHVRARGEECAAGTTLLPAGTPVTPVLVGLAAATGHDTLLVRPRPRVLALVTGAELLTAGLAGNGRIRDALGPVLPGLVAALGGELVGVRRVGDDPTALAAAVTAALADPDADVVLTSGACSVGRADHLHSVLARTGARLVVDGVACRPGHPQLLAIGARPVVGLPGNPLAALVGALTLLGPLLAGLAGRSLPVLGRAALGQPVAVHPGHTRLLPVRRAHDAVVPVEHAGSAMLRGAAAADALAVVLPDEGAVGPDECLPVGRMVDLVELPR